MEKEANIIKLLVSSNNLQNSIIIEDKNYHIYVINSEEIKEGDWYMYCHFGEWIISNSRETLKKGTNTLENLNKDNYFKKIIATTDSEVKIHVGTCFGMEELFKPLPRLSDDFIKAYVKAQGKIDKVLVEYYNLNGQESGQLIKIASDNTITIKPVQEVYVSKKALPFVIEALGFDPTKEKEKTSWNRNEVIEIIKCFSVALQERKSGHVYDFRDKWIKENLK